MTKFKRLCAVAVLGLAAATPALADGDRISLHGFGNQDYWKSSANSFDGSGRGTWDNNFVGLDLTVTLTDRSKVWAQLETASNETPNFTWIFVDYDITDQLRAHVGAVRFPMGIFNEYIDTRALENWVVLPSVYSQEADMIHDSYEGVGLDYDIDLGRPGRLTLQGLVGNTYEPPVSTPTPPFPAQAGQSSLQADTVDRHVYGGRVTWQTPVAGLRLLLSGNQTLVATTSDNGQVPNQTGTENRWIASIDYAGEALDLKSEFNHHTIPGLDGFARLTSEAWYAQAAYRFGRWTPYVRYDSITTDTARAGDPSYYQRGRVIGLNRKLNENFNVRVEGQFNHGYALPVAAGETLVGSGKTDWQLFAASVNFQF
jgi:hypothetical protein